MINIHPFIYLDYHSTTPVDSRVTEKVLHHMTTDFGNASSIDHIYGDVAEAAIKQARKQVANLVDASPQEIIFTSGATESINLAIQGLIRSENQGVIAISPVEHQAVLDTCQALAKTQGTEIIPLKVDQRGRLDLEYLEAICSQDISLLCVMAANNEIGNIYPVKEMAHIAWQNRVPFLCDATQAVGKIPIKFREWGITFLAFSAHKIYGPKGVGALVVKKGFPLKPILFGGSQQKGIRPGTLNVPGIVGLGEACHLHQREMATDEARIATLRDKLQQLLQEKIPELVVNGDINSRLAGNLHISIPRIPNSAVIARVRHQLAISTGAACSSGVETPSHVLRAMNLSADILEGALRIGVGKFTTKAEIEQAADILADTVQQIRKTLNS